MKLEVNSRSAMSMSVGAGAVIAIIVVVGVIVYLTAPIPSQRNTSSAQSATVVIPQGASTGADFSPASLSVVSGTTVSFVDQDSGAAHDVYFTSVPAGATISGNPSQILQKGDSYQVTLTTVGIYKYECQFHGTWMQGTISVT